MSVTIAMPRMSTDPELTTAQSKYVESLARAGAEVHWVELSDPDAAVTEALTCDGLLLPGGGDMDPAFYGQERLPACGEPNLLRDAAEPKLLRAFLAADKPVLGICRGIQVMNVVLGGTLYQDIKPFEHVPHNDHWAKVHTVTVRRGTLMSRLLGQDTVLVNSQHHQAADRIAPELEIAALSEDGIVEALEKPDAHFCLGVQWHPEWLSDADPAQQGLFGAFVEACRGNGFSRWWRGAGFLFRSNGLRSARARGRAGFSLSWFSRWWRGAVFSFGQMALRSARARGREGCFESPLPTSGLHSPRNELRAARP